MTLDIENVLPSDAIKYALNHPASIPSEVRDAASRTRVSLSVNTHYPEIAGGYYLNWRVLGVIDQAILDVGLYVMHPDVLLGDQTKRFPIDRLISSDQGEVYCLCQVDGTKCGQVMKWSFSTGGGGAFFSDNLIVDMFVENSFQARIIDALVERCDREQIRLKLHRAGSSI